MVLPEEFLCGITQELPKDPVLTLTGQIYERAAIQTWLEKSDRDPNTGQELKDKTLIPIFALKTFLEKL